MIAECEYIVLRQIPRILPNEIDRDITIFDEISSFRNKFRKWNMVFAIAGS